MDDPVVSSRFGKRPLVDVPPMHVTTGSHQAIYSLQKPVKIHEPLPPPHSAGPVYVEPAVFPRPYHTAPHPYHTAPHSYHTAPSPDPFHYNHYDPHVKTRHFYGPNGEVVKPLEHYFEHRHHYPGIHYPPPPPPPPPPVAVHPLPPPNPHYHVHPPAHSSQIPQEFDVDCDLEYGRIARISVKESRGHFRGIPEYLRRELTKSYGRYPFIQVKLKYHNGDFHVFANYGANRRKRDRERHEERPRDRFYEEEEEEEYDTGYDHERHSDTYTDGIRPQPMGAPRGILREKGWNKQR